LRLSRAALAALLCLLLVGVIVAGCGGGGSSSSSGGSETEAEAEPAAGGEEENAGGEEEEASGEPLTVGYVAYSLAATPQQELKAGQEEEAKKYGYTLKVADGGGEATKEIAAIQTFVTQGVDAIVLDSYSEGTIKAALLAAEAAEIPVYMSSSPGEQPNLAGAIAENNATELTEKMAEEMGGKGNVLAFTLPSGPNCEYSREQFEEVMEKFPEIKYREQPVKVPGYQQEAVTATAGWLKSQPKGEKLSIWGCWDGPAVPAATAAAEAGRIEEIGVYGQNTEPATVSLLEKGEYTLSYYFESRAGGRKIMELVHSNAGKSYSEIEPQFERGPAIEVNQENVAEVIKKYPQILGE
jgi:ribose transport system substrate-binding protein